MGKDIADKSQEDKDMDNDIADKSQENKDVDKDIAHENQDGNHNQKAENVEDKDSDSSSSSSYWNSDWHETWERVLTLSGQVDSGHKRRILISMLRTIAHCHTRWHEER